MTEVLLLSPPTLRLVAPPGEAHDDSYDDGDLNGSDDGGDEDVMQLLTTRHHVEDVKVQELIALRATVRRLTPAGGQVVSHLALAVLTELGVVFMTRGGNVDEPFPVARFGDGVDVWFALHTIVLPALILTASHMFDINLQLFQAGRLADVTRCVIGDAIISTHRVVIVAVTHDVTHAEHIFRIFITFCTKLAVSTFGDLFPTTRAFIISITRS